jgi:hypothetical protein
VALTYATEQDLEEYLLDAEGIDVPEGEAAERLLARAEADVDLVLGPIARNATTGRKIDPATLTTIQRAALSRATCAAAEWRLAMDEDDLVVQEDGIRAVAGITFAPMPRPPGPKVLEELADYGLVKRSGTVLPTPPEDGAQPA